ncbi:MAG: hypothetical protein EHM23_27370, partial [Acidobacteria bacterium]
MTDQPLVGLEADLYAEELKRRLDALDVLCKTVEPGKRRGTNLHIHTNESFSVFRSPTEAVWQAAREGVAVFGINDHYTCAGHDEFRRACEIARLPATFSMEAIAMDREAEADGRLTNDPGNPGRTYLCAKGVTRIPPDDSVPMQNLNRIRAALDRRHRDMSQKLREFLQETAGLPGPDWDEVVALTPRGNVTERHIAKAAAIWVRNFAISRGLELAEAVPRCFHVEPTGFDEVTLQNFIRSKLLKVGGPCYVEETPEAFLSIDEMRDLFLGFGAIPTYPVLANPVTDGERDIHALMDRLESINIFALEVIPARNTKERLAEVIEAARERSWPVFNGTEHNTPSPAPLLAELSLDPDFLPWFKSSAAVLLGHHKLVANGQPGFVGAEGKPSISDAGVRLDHFV